MDMRPTLPDWLAQVAWTYITFSLLSAALIAFDIYLSRRRHPRVSTELVWITSGLYLGPFAVGFYLRHGRADVTSRAAALGATEHQRTVFAVLSGGGASAVAHLIAVPLVLAIGWTIAGMAMWPMIIVIFGLASALLVINELASNGASSAQSRRRISLGAALVVGCITVAAFDIGMVGWMLLLHFNDSMPEPKDVSFWFLMQLGVIAGLITGYPAVRWLLRRDQTAFRPETSHT